MLENIECLGHSSIKIKKAGLVIYIDPFRLNEESNDADMIFITHNHYDHFSAEDIRKIKNDETKIIITPDLFEASLNLGFYSENIIRVTPNCEYTVKDIKFETIPAYNINKPFHPKENNWVGYIIELDNRKYYIAGDTDITEDNMKVKCDVAFIPVGGTYTMNTKEASELINHIKPQIAVPIHYGSIVGTKEDGEIFKSLLNDEIECEILIK